MRNTVYWIEGDGIGPEIWAAARPVMDTAVRASYGDKAAMEWVELLAGDKAVKNGDTPLPRATLEALGRATYAIKGPLGTPVGGGMRSLNVTLRQTFDLYACIRPVRWVPGTAAPVKRPDLVDMVIFRENTEDVYAGIEYAAHTPEADRLGAFLRDELGAKVRPGTALGIKPVTEEGSKRLVRRAINYALDRGLPSVTLVHKGNIMKFTEGAFRAWGYEVAAEFGDKVVTEAGARLEGETRLVVKDRIADAMFQNALLNPEKYSVIATLNLNGDYLSDALAAQVGGLGMAPGVNKSDTLAIYEATHGTAPAIAGKDMANPGSLLLSGAMMLDDMGLEKAGTLVRDALAAVIADRTVTCDLAADMDGARTVGCAEFGRLLTDKVEMLAG